MFYSHSTIFVRSTVVKRHKRAYFPIVFPQKIDIGSTHDRKATLATLTALKKASMSGKKEILLDFSKTQKVFSSAMIIIYAELINIINTYSDIHFKCARVRNDKVGQVLTQIGIYKLCRQNVSVKPTHSDVIHWRVCSGVKVISKKIDDIISIEELSLLPSTTDIYGGCIEATKNVLRHAYIRPRKILPVADKHTAWWCFSQIKDDKLTVVVCDLGVSIPETLPITFPSFVEHMKSLGLGSDAGLIKGALQRPSSRSGEQGRGNGLPKIAEVVKLGGNLTIFSRRGCVHVAGEETYLENYRQPLLGTVITWTLPLGGEK